MSLKTFATCGIIAISAVLGGSHIGHADIAGFGDFSGYKINQVDAAASPTITLSPSTIALTGPGINEARSIFYDTPQSTTHFAASFTYQETGGPDIVGFAFVLQNDVRGASAVGGDENGLGYGFGSFITPSAAVEFPLYTPFLTGLFTNGATGIGANSLSPVSLLSGDPINVFISYNGAILSESVTDISTGQSSPTFLYPISLPTTAYVGIAASTNDGTTQELSNFQYVATPEPSSVVLLGMGAGVFGLGVYRRSRVRRRLAGQQHA